MSTYLSIRLKKDYFYLTETFLLNESSSVSLGLQLRTIIHVIKKNMQTLVDAKKVAIFLADSNKNYGAYHFNRINNHYH